VEEKGGGGGGGACKAVHLINSAVDGVTDKHHAPANLPLGKRPGTHLQETRWVEASWNVMAHAQKKNFVFRRKGRVHLNRLERQFSRLLTAELCAPAVVMLGTPCSEVVWRVLLTHSIRQFPLHFDSRASPCAITFQLEYTRADWNRCSEQNIYTISEPCIVITRTWARQTRCTHSLIIFCSN